MNDRLILSIQSIKDRTRIESNVEPARLLPHVIDAQRVDLQNVLGTALFKVYLDAVQEDGTLSGLTPTQILFHEEYISPMLALYVEARYLLRGGASLSNTGIVRVKTDKTDPVSLEDARHLSKASKNDAEFYALRAKEFICENYEDLGRYINATDQNLPPAVKIGSFGIYTGPRRGGNE